LKLKSTPRSVVVISDTHAGDYFGLYPCDTRVSLDEGAAHDPTPLQRKMWAHWLEFRDEWIPWATKCEPFILAHNGDALDGVHHGAVTQFTHNLKDQRKVAEALLAPIVERASAYYHIRGTEAHAGASGQDEEALAESLGAIADETGHSARWELWLELHGYLGHITHHVGTTSSSAYESTAVYKELVEAYVEAGRWGDRPPQFIVRSHRHRHFEVRVHAERGSAMAIVTPGWQLKTPFTYKVAGARQAQPQIGGIIVRAGSDILYSDSKVWRIERPRAEVYGD
jgi:hypothetical protein